MNVKTVTSAADDDDWETDPDFVVSLTMYTYIVIHCTYTTVCSRPLLKLLFI